MARIENLPALAAYREADGAGEAEGGDGGLGRVSLFAVDRGEYGEARV